MYMIYIFCELLGSPETNGNSTYLAPCQVFQCNGQCKISTCFDRTIFFHKHTKINQHNVSLTPSKVWHKRLILSLHCLFLTCQSDVDFSDWSSEKALPTWQFSGRLFNFSLNEVTALLMSLVLSGLPAYNIHFTHSNKLTQTRRQKLSCWFSGCVQPSTLGPKIHREFEFKPNTLNVTKVPLKQAQGFFCCGCIKFGTPSLPFNSNCAQQQDDTKLISKYHAFQSCMSISSKKRSWPFALLKKPAYK